jgi:cellulose synthase operon protein C
MPKSASRFLTGPGLLSLFGAALAVIAPVASAVAAPDPNAKSAFSRAEQAHAARDYRTARVELMNAIDEDGQWPVPHILLASVSLDLFDPIAARAEIDRAVALGAKPAQINHLMGHVLWMQGQGDRALAVLTSAPLERQHRAYAHRIIGRIYLDRNEIERAQTAFDAGIKLAPGDSMLWTELGRLRSTIGNQGGAIDALDTAVKLDPNNIRALELRGQFVRTQYGLVAALPWFERGLQINPNDVPLLEEYGVTLGEAGRYRDMLAQARKIISLDSNNSKAFYMQAVIAARGGNSELARRLMARVTTPLGDLPAPRLLLAIVEYDLGNWNQSVDIFEQLVDAQPYNLNMRILLARAMHRAGDQQGAWDTIVPVANRADADSYTLTLAARISEALDERGQANERLQRAGFPSSIDADILPESSPQAAAADDARRNPHDARKVIPHVRLLLAANNITAARAEISQLVQGNNGVADAHILAGDVEMAGGNTGAAVSAYERARSISFTTPVMIRLVNALRKSGRGDVARKVLSDFLVFNPSSLAALRLAAYDHLDNKRWKEAVPGLLAVRDRIGINDAVLNANIARAYSGSGQHDLAISEAALAYRIAPGNVMVTYMFGQVLQQAGRRDVRAKSMLRKANKMAPDDANIRRAYQAILRPVAITKKSLKAKKSAK